MTLAQTLGYVMKPPNAAQRAVQRVSATSFGSWLIPKLQPPLDKALFRVTGGTTTAASLLSGLPVILLTTSGAKTGMQRTTPIFGIPVGDDLALIGSNYGRTSAPAWVYNLAADPAATVTFREHTVAVTARRATETETEQVFVTAASIYRGYSQYRGRAAHRDIKVFILEPAQ